MDLQRLPQYWPFIEVSNDYHGQGGTQLHTHVHKVWLIYTWEYILYNSKKQDLDSILRYYIHHFLHPVILDGFCHIRVIMFKQQIKPNLKFRIFEIDLVDREESTYLGDKKYI